MKHNQTFVWINLFLSVSINFRRIRHYCIAIKVELHPIYRNYTVLGKKLAVKKLTFFIIATNSNEMSMLVCLFACLGFMTYQPLYVI